MDYDFKQEVLKTVITGMIQNGMQKDIAEAFYLLLERVYDSGYNEARRNIREKQQSPYSDKWHGGPISDGGMDPRYPRE